MSEADMQHLCRPTGWRGRLRSATGLCLMKSWTPCCPLRATKSWTCLQGEHFTIVELGHISYKDCLSASLFDKARQPCLFAHLFWSARLSYTVIRVQYII